MWPPTPKLFLSFCEGLWPPWGFGPRITRGPGPPAGTHCYPPTGADDGDDGPVTDSIAHAVQVKSISCKLTLRHVLHLKDPP